MNEYAIGYHKKLKQLNAQTQKLRGWIGSDPTRLPELIDALLKLVEYRLAWHDFTDIAKDCQEGFTLAAKQLALAGPLGPYTKLIDASRLASFAVQLARIKLLAGNCSQVSEIMQTVYTLAEILSANELTSALTNNISIWGLINQVETALAQEDISRANQLADAAIEITGSGFSWIDVKLIWAKARWRAGFGSVAVSALWNLREKYEAEVIGRDETAISPIQLARILTPAAEIYNSLADYLWALDEREVALSVRRELVKIYSNCDAELEKAKSYLAGDLVDMGLSEANEISSHPVSRPRLKLSDSKISWSKITTEQLFVKISSDTNLVEYDSDAISQKLQEVRDCEKELIKNTEDELKLRAIEEEKLKAETERNLAQRKLASELAQLESEQQEQQQELALRAEAKQLRAERIAAHQKIEQQLSQLRQDFVKAQSAEQVLKIGEDLVEVLNPLFEEDPIRYGNEIIDVLQRMVKAKKQSGDWWGSRKIIRQAKSYEKRIKR